MNESEFEQAIVDAARVFGWKIVGHRPMRTKHGWATGWKYDGTGWPDLTMIHADRGLLIAAEPSKQNSPASHTTSGDPTTGTKSSTSSPTAQHAKPSPTLPTGATHQPNASHGHTDPATVETRGANQCQKRHPASTQSKPNATRR